VGARLHAARSWESSRNLLILHVHLDPQLGKKRCKIKAVLRTHAPLQTAPLLDHLVGASEEWVRTVRLDENFPRPTHQFVETSVSGILVPDLAIVAHRPGMERQEDVFIGVLRMVSLAAE
jgi:hypothetical protein